MQTFASLAWFFGGYAIDDFVRAFLPPYPKASESQSVPQSARSGEHPIIITMRKRWTYRQVRHPLRSRVTLLASLSSESAREVGYGCDAEREVLLRRRRTEVGEYSSSLDIRGGMNWGCFGWKRKLCGDVGGKGKGERRRTGGGGRGKVGAGRLGPALQVHISQGLVACCGLNEGFACHSKGPNPVKQVGNARYS